MNIRALEPPKDPGMHLKDLFAPPDLKSNPRVIAAEEFKDTAIPDPGVDYDWVYDYAKEVYAQKMATRDSHDAKAGEIIKYLGGGTGLFTIGALMNVNGTNQSVLVWALPSFGCVLASLLLAILARKPNDTPIPPKVKAAKEYAEAFKDTRLARAEFIGQWHLASEALCVTNETAANRVGWSIWMMFLAIVSLAFPILAAILK